MRSSRSEWDLQFIAHVLDDVEEMTLLLVADRPAMMDLVDNEHFHVDGHEHSQRLALQCGRRVNADPLPSGYRGPTSEPGRRPVPIASPSPRIWLATTPTKFHKEGPASNVRSVGWTFISCIEKA